MAKTFTPKLHTCTIAKRGKGVQGTVTIATFGVPLKPKKGENKSVTRRWDYSPYLDPSVKLQELIDLAEAHNYNVKEAIVVGCDTLKKTSGIRKASEVSIITAQIIALGLAQTEDDAKETAKQFQTYRSSCAAMSRLVPSIEELIEELKERVKKLIASGNWASKLVTKTDDEEETEEETTDEEETTEDEDSDDTEDDEESK